MRKNGSIYFEFQAQDSIAPLVNSEEFKKLTLPKSASAISLITPRILELDINRMMISQNQIS